MENIKVLIMLLDVCFKFLTWIDKNSLVVKNSNGEAGNGNRLPTSDEVRVLVVVVFLLILYIIGKIATEQVIIF